MVTTARAGTNPRWGCVAGPRNASGVGFRRMRMVEQEPCHKL